MKKLFFTLALAVGFLTTQAQDDSKSVSGDTLSTKTTKMGKDAKKKSGKSMDKSAGTSTGTATDTLTTPTTPVDTTNKARKPEEE